LAVIYRGPHTFSRQRGDVSDRVLVGMAICRQVPKIRDACDETAVVLAVDHPQYQTLYMHYLYAQPGKRKTDGVAAAIEARATIANRATPARASS
jgi:hypothetical protein